MFVRTNSFTKPGRVARPNKHATNINTTNKMSTNKVITNIIHEVKALHIRQMAQSVRIQELRAIASKHNVRGKSRAEIADRLVRKMIEG